MAFYSVRARDAQQGRREMRAETCSEQPARAPAQFKTHVPTVAELEGENRGRSSAALGSALPLLASLADKAGRGQTRISGGLASRQRERSAGAHAR